MISLEFLQLLTYFVFVLSIVAYATLDGFDLGVGALHLLTKGDHERRLMINAIGPVWDGNTTWLVVGTGVLFAGFPRAFANLSSGLYTPTMMLLFGFMLRGAAIEFRSKFDAPRWRSFWDIAFSFASLLLAVLVGLILANLIQGLPLNRQGEYSGGLIELITPYAILTTLFGVSLFTMHGALYLQMKTEGAFHDKVRKWTRPLVAFFLFFWLASTIATFYIHPKMIAPFFAYPFLNVFVLLSFASIASLIHFVRKNKDYWSFFSSCMCIIFLLTLFIIGIFPNIVYSSVEPVEHSLTLYNCSASETSLIVLAIIGLTGIPLAFFYGAYVYRVFRGKVKLDHTSY